MALFVILFILLINFLLRSMDRFLGKGLETPLILEFIFLNLAWILALAVPMATLISTLMAYGRLSSDNEISAMRAISASYSVLINPALFFSIIIATIMMYFNNQILPEMNHKSRMLSSDISRKRPDLNFDVGYFIDAIPDYKFLIGNRDGKIFKDITILNSKNKYQLQTIIAKTGTINTVNNGVVLYLDDGIIHEYIGNNKNEYREILFDRYAVMIPVDNMQLNRRNSKIRGDREMTFTMINDKVEVYNEKIDKTLYRINNRLSVEAEKLNIIINLDSLDKINPNIASKILNLFEESINDSISKTDKASNSRIERRLANLKRGIESDFSLIKSYSNSINKYLVELHKKFSIPFASIVFILIGAPIGILSRQRGIAVSAVLSLGIFIIYWAFLIAGEEFADRGLLSPMLSMWLPNIILGVIGLYIYFWYMFENSVQLIKIYRKRNKKC